MRTVTVRIGSEAGSWWARSDDMPRWTAVGESLDELRRLVGEAVPIYFEPETGPFEVIEVFESDARVGQG